MATSSKPRVWLWLAVLAPLAVVGTAALLVGAGLVFNASGQSEPVAVDERELLLDVEHLAQWMDGYEPDPDAGMVSKTRYFDDSYDLEYQYDAAGDGIYLTYSITFETTPVDAQTTYASFWGGTHVGLFGVAAPKLRKPTVRTLESGLVA